MWLQPPSHYRAWRAVNQAGVREASQNAWLLLRRLKFVPSLKPPTSATSDPDVPIDEVLVSPCSRTRLQKLRQAAGKASQTDGRDGEQTVAADTALVDITMEDRGPKPTITKKKKGKKGKKKDVVKVKQDPELFVSTDCPAGLLLSFALPSRVARPHATEPDCYTLVRVRPAAPAACTAGSNLAKAFVAANCRQFSFASARKSHVASGKVIWPEWLAMLHLCKRPPQMCSAQEPSPTRVLITWVAIVHFVVVQDQSLVKLPDDENLTGAARLVVSRIAPGRVEPPPPPKRVGKGYTPPRPKPPKPIVTLAAPLTAADAIKHAESMLSVAYEVNWSVKQNRAMLSEVLMVDKVRPCAVPPPSTPSSAW